MFCYAIRVNRCCWEKVWFTAESSLTALYLGIFVLSLLLSFVLTRSVRAIATARGWVTAPLQDRHLHQAPLPRLGGIAIFVSFLLSVGVALLAREFFLHTAAILSSKTLFTILVPGTLIFLLGVYDDIHSVGPHTKFAIQVVGAILLFAGGLRILDLPVLFGARHFGWTEYFSSSRVVDQCFQSNRRTRRLGCRFRTILDPGGLRSCNL